MISAKQSWDVRRILPGRHDPSPRHLAADVHNPRIRLEEVLAKEDVHVKHGRLYVANDATLDVLGIQLPNRPHLVVGGVVDQNVQGAAELPLHGIGETLRGLCRE